jgi:formyl-CoA transferase
MTETAMPLSRFKVLDLCRARAGPTCVRQLADWGADTIKIEVPPGAGWVEDDLETRHGFDFFNIHRNKRGLTLNLKNAEGKAIFLRLAERADVVVENFRPGVKHRLGIDYEAVRAVNPRIVYASISGFGQDGPYAERAGLDQIAQGISGLMSVTGLPGQGPVRAGIPICDLSAGLLAAQGVLLALLEREVSGQGQWVHTSLTEAMIQMMDFQAARYLKDGEVPVQQGNNHPTNSPTGVFETLDGSINIQASPQHLFRRMAETLGAPELTERAEYRDHADRVKNRDRLNAEIEALTRQKTSAEWIDAFAEAGVPAGPIYSVDECFADPQVRTLDMDPSVEHPELGTVRLVGQALKMSRTPQRMRSPTPELGQHVDEILGELGFDTEAIAGLRARGVV